MQVATHITLNNHTPSGVYNNKKKHTALSTNLEDVGN